MTTSSAPFVTIIRLYKRKAVYVSIGAPSIILTNRYIITNWHTGIMKYASITCMIVEYEVRTW